MFSTGEQESKKQYSSVAYLCSSFKDHLEVFWNIFDKIEIKEGFVILN